MREKVIPLVGGSGAAGVLYALPEFLIGNLDVLMAAIGPFAFRIAPHVPALDATVLQRIYIALAILSAILAVGTLVSRAQEKFD